MAHLPVSFSSLSPDIRFDRDLDVPKPIPSRRNYLLGAVHTEATCRKRLVARRFTTEGYERVQNILKLWKAWTNLNQNRDTYYLQTTKETVGNTGTIRSGVIKG